ncbi:MAG: efflux RND transporter periplasmic adaptor subunit [Chromatiales bacterium]|nr:efflux RND transporter periplasmic adaptor subunit [Gammaproteobacteria bacterium]MCP5230645.1 efflux RND transporter periplasmic adaptor subunit [Zoogloeaceae bacterium]MCP5352906.1 efflux RND transporter periplasmic adaptor subunit [Chromatiales bacterium]
MLNKSLITLAALMTGGIGLVTVVATNTHAESVAVAAPADDVLETVQAARHVIPAEQVLDGVVEAINQSTVSARTSGTVSELYFDINDYVVKGAVLMRVDDTEQRAGVNRARAGLDEAEAVLKQTSQEHERIKAVFAEGAVSKNEMDKVEANLKAAQARTKSARANLVQAEEQLQYATVEAPFSGIVTERKVEVGETVQPGTPLMTGVSLEELRVAVDVPQTLIAIIKEGGKARVIFGADRSRSVVADRLNYFPYANPINHTFRVRVYMDAGPETLYPGMYVKVAFQTGERERLLIPHRAVVYRGDVTATYVVGDDGNPRLRMLRVGKVQDGDLIEVLSGLDAGEKVAIDPIRAGVFRKEHVGDDA